MCADIRDGQEQKRSIQGPDTEAQDQLSPDHHIQLATHGRSIHKCHVWTAPAVQEECEARSKELMVIGSSKRPPDGGAPLYRGAAPRWPAMTHSWHVVSLRAFWLGW